MSLTWILPALTLIVNAAESGYVRPDRCRSCHVEIFESYARTGMARSFARIESVPLLEEWTSRFVHRASSRVYSVARRNSGFFLRRTLPDGRAAIEKQIHYVIGSGNHSRTYLHRKENGRLIELPLSWYSENAGHWAMSPGYDRADHADFQREIPDSCLFCHNGYPSESNGGLAAGIDCQRCHGPGEAHVERRGPIVNPGRLPTERRMEVCLQCHLESASRTIPDSIRRYDRGPFSFRPGEPLGNFTIYFDRETSAPEESITVNHSAYGLRQSNCFIRSAGKLLCTTCHDPHRADFGSVAEKRYMATCRSCHSSVHPERAAGCVACHMPKRRADDAVHVVITDHNIRRTAPPSDVAAVKQEKHDRYVGPVRLYYPPALPASPENHLYLAIAALTDSSRLRQAIDRLETAIEDTRPGPADFYVRLADACRQAGQRDRAMVHYRRVIEKDPQHRAGLTALAELLLEGGQVGEAIRVLEDSLVQSPREPVLLNSLAVAYGRESRFADAEKLVRRALSVDEDSPLTWLNLGVCLQAQGRNDAAANAYRNALRLQPDFSRARVYLDQLAR